MNLSDFSLDSYLFLQTFFILSQKCSIIFPHKAIKRLLLDLELETWYFWCYYKSFKISLSNGFLLVYTYRSIYYVLTFVHGYLSEYSQSLIIFFWNFRPGDCVVCEFYFVFQVLWILFPPFCAVSANSAPPSLIPYLIGNPFRVLH